jgi:hypothetical protein
MPYVMLDMGLYIEGKPQPEGHFDAMSHKDAYADNIKWEVWETKLNELLEYLVDGKLPVGVKCKKPKLSPSQAADLIWFLQEVTKIIPEEYAVCDGCKTIYYTDMMSYYETNGKHYCESCDQHHSPICRCEYCGNVEVYKSKSWSEEEYMYLCKDCRKELREKKKRK